MSDDPTTPPDPEVPDGGGAPPPPLPPAPQPWGAMDEPVEVPTPVAAPQARRPWLLIAVVAVAVLVVIVVASGGGGVDLPDRLAGQPRVTEGPAVAQMDMLADMDIEGMSFDVAMYGPSLNPAYMVMTVEGDVDAQDGELLSTLPTGMFSSGGGEIDFSQQITAEVDGTEYVCAPGQSTGAPVQVAMCIFVGDHAGVVIGLASTDLNALMATTQGLVAEL